MMELPPGWEARMLGDLGRYLNGRAFKSSEWSTTGRPIIRIQNLTGSGREFNYYEGEVADRYVVRHGDLLVSWAATLGAYLWDGPEGVLNQHIFKVESNIDKRFHKYLIESKVAEMMGQTHGSGMVHITKSKFDSIPVAVPPLDEQRRIVAILEDHLSRLDAATGGLRAAGARSDALQRRAIVELLSVGGPESELRDVLEVSIGGLWGEPPGMSDLDVMVIRVTELGMWGTLDPRTSAIRSVTHKQYESRSLQLGDLLLEKSGGGPATPVGRVGLVTGLEGPAICSNFMQLMRPDPSRILPRWLHLYLNACHLAGRTNKMQKATTNIRNIKASEYLQMVISVPTLDEQESVVAACESWLLRGSRLKATVGELRGRAVALRRALLQSAFSGELTRESISV